VRMLAEQSKNGKPVTFSLPTPLTVPFDHYLDVVRPRMLRQCGTVSGNVASSHDYVFFKRNGAAPRTDFSSHTNTVTLELIGRAINAHAFRAAVITTFYTTTGASQTEMNALADIMAHDPATARNFYFRPQFEQASVVTNQKMVDILLGQQ
jgi:hypothetical protein